MQYILALLFLLIGLRIFSYKDFFEKIYLLNKKYKKLLVIEVTIVYLNYLILFITRLGFDVHNGSSIYVGVYTNPHPMGYSLIILIIVTTYLSKYYSKKMVLYYPLAIILLIYTSARTPTIIGIILIILLNIKIENRIEVRKITIGIVAISTIMLMTIIFHEVIQKLIINTPMIEKFLMTSNKSILSGRDDFWPLLINDYLYEFNFIEKIFGHGVYYSMYLNFRNYNMVIWAHNDILDIVISFGMIIMLVYLYTYIRYFVYLFNNYHEKLKVILVTACTSCLMLLNGIINYPFFLMFFFYMGICFFEKKSIGGKINEDTLLY
jgi:hypothetical protein